MTDTPILVFGFVMVSDGLAPYASKQDAWLSPVANIDVYLSMLQALMLKVDVSNESIDSQEVFGGVLMATDIAMGAVLIVEAVMAIVPYAAVEMLL